MAEGNYLQEAKVRVVASERVTGFYVGLEQALLVAFALSSPLCLVLHAGLYHSVHLLQRLSVHRLRSVPSAELLLPLLLLPLPLPTLSQSSSSSLEEHRCL